MKYRIETGVETKTSLTTIKLFNNASELKDYIKSLDKDIWYSVEYADTHQEIFNYNSNKGIKYNNMLKCPKVLQYL